MIRVLIAEDEPDVRAALVELLSADARVEVVGVGGTTEQAVALAVQHAPDVVLMDFKMPGGGGAVATRLVRQRHRGTHVLRRSA
jgi:DNA-binding NarL/FixJ family response regulator